MRPLTHAFIKTSFVATTLVFAVAASASAEPQHDRGHFGGGAPRAHFSGAPRANVGVPRAHVVAPRAHVIAPRVHVVRPHVFVRGSFYDPFWGPYYPYWDYPYAYPYGVYSYPMTEPAGDVQTKVTPKDTQVYVDGYFAGVADDYDGTFQRLHAAAGGHAVTFYLDGYRTVTENIYVRPGSTSKLTETMEKLAPGEVSEPVPPPAYTDGTTAGGSVPQQ